MQPSQIFSTTTNSIKITAQPIFMADQSIHTQSLYFWAYNITIENYRLYPVQLLRRHWKIIDSNGDIIEVQGEGVVGDTPLLKPQEHYQYTSGTYLKTASGVMVGAYIMKCQVTHHEFEVKIPTFSLDSPYDKHKLT